MSAADASRESQQTTAPRRTFASSWTEARGWPLRRVVHQPDYPLMVCGERLDGSRRSEIEERGCRPGISGRLFKFQIQCSCSGELGQPVAQRIHFIHCIHCILGPSAATALYGSMPRIIRLGRRRCNKDGPLIFGQGRLDFIRNQFFR